MAKYQYGSAGFFKQLQSFAEGASGSAEVEAVVTDILQAVAKRGDRALFELTAKLDGAPISAESIRLSPEELEHGVQSLSPGEQRAVGESIRCVESFNRQSMPENWTGKNPHGATVGERYYPIRRVGIYVPGGSVPLVSTVIMTATLAKIANVGQICVCTPPDRGGTIAPAMAGVLSLCGVDEVYKAGGAQAVAAMAYGTESVPPVDKIFGPGNAFVNEAKRQLFGKVGIDLLPGPSELMVIADFQAEPQFVAADLLAQAEHGSGKEKIYLVSTSGKISAEVERAMAAQVLRLTHREAVEKVLETNFALVEAPHLDAAVEVANFVAPEHLQLQVDNEAVAGMTRRITTAGAIMQGNFTATALGDFTAGPSHELPTGRAGRFSSGLTVRDFFRRSSVVRYGKPEVIKAAPTVEAFARMENLDAHGRSVSIRAE